MKPLRQEIEKMINDMKEIYVLTRDDEARGASLALQDVLAELDKKIEQIEKRKEFYDKAVMDLTKSGKDNIARNVFIGHQSECVEVLAILRNKRSVEE